MSECIEVHTSIGGDGYPRKSYTVAGVKKSTSLIRYVWEQANGPIPEGYQPDHVVCKNIRCINLDHVEIVTAAENNRRAHQKLTVEQVLEIRSRLGTTTKAALARKFGVSFMTITFIERRKTWKDV